MATGWKHGMWFSSLVPGGTFLEEPSAFTATHSLIPPPPSAFQKDCKVVWIVKEIHKDLKTKSKPCAVVCAYNPITQEARGSTEWVDVEGQSEQCSKASLKINKLEMWAAIKDDRKVGDLQQMGTWCHKITREKDTEVLRSESQSVGHSRTWGCKANFDLT